MRFKNGVNKRGWIRITEAVVAILIMASVLIVLYTNETPQISLSDYVYDLQIRLLTEVADRADLREATLNSTVDDINTTLKQYFDESIPTNFVYNISVCDLGDLCTYAPNVETEVYVEDRIISSSLTTYSPKMLRLYIWEKR
jgi:hypothetical protein